MRNFQKQPNESTWSFAERIESEVEQKMTEAEYQAFRRYVEGDHQRFYVEIGGKEVACVTTK